MLFLACMVVSQCVAVMMCSNQGESIYEKGVKYVQTMCNKSPIISHSLSLFSLYWLQNLLNNSKLLPFSTCSKRRKKFCFLLPSMFFVCVLRRFCSNVKMACIEVKRGDDQGMVIEFFLNLESVGKFTK